METEKTPGNPSENGPLRVSVETKEPERQGAKRSHEHPKKSPQASPSGPIGRLLDFLTSRKRFAPVPLHEWLRLHERVTKSLRRIDTGTLRKIALEWNPRRSVIGDLDEADVPDLPVGVPEDRMALVDYVWDCTVEHRRRDPDGSLWVCPNGCHKLFPTDAEKTG